MFGLSSDLTERLARERPVVVMGRGHSGTRVLAWALEALGICMGTLEEKPTGDAQDRRFTRRIKRIAMRHVSRPATGEPSGTDRRRFRKAAWRYLEWMDERRETWSVEGRDPEQVSWGWKFPETYIVGNVVEAVFPKALHVHMVRDGRDLAFKDHLTDDSTRGLGRRVLEHLGTLDEPHYLQAAKSWAWQVRRFNELAASLPPERVHSMTFEGLCQDPIATMESLADFLGVPMNETCRDYLDKNIRRGKVSQHRSEEPAKVRAVEEAIADTLRACGYEPSER